MFKKISALLLAAVVAVMCFAGCHKKGETVLSLDGYEIPSGLYLAVQLNSFNQFSSEVQSQLGSNNKPSSITDYLKYSIDSVSAEDWIHNKTIEALRSYVAVERKFAEAGLSLEKTDTSMVDYYMQYYWDYYGYKSFYEANGVSSDSYRLIWENTAKSNKLFTYYYDKADEETGLGGIYAVSDEDIVKYLGENYILADRLTITVSDDGDVTAESAMSKLNGYARRINSGISFETIKEEYDAENPSDTSSTAQNVSANPDNTSIYSKTATVYTQSANTSVYSAMAQLKADSTFEYSKAIVTDDSANGSCYLTVIYDITKDDYYINSYRSSVLSNMKGEEFTNLLKTTGDAYTLDENKSLVNRYSALKIKAAEK